MNATLSNVAAPQSAYVHVPFCRHRCGYCNFTVVAGRDDLIEDYLSAIEIELSWLEQPRPVNTLFLGGGTPTHLTLEQLNRFLDTVLRWFSLNDGAEFSIEANPEDLNLEKVQVLVEFGVNRVSLGVQSFNDQKLKTLERSHTAADIARCLQLLRPKIQSVSLDLIFGSPEESIAAWRNDLSLALALEPDHVSTYGLTYELGTRFYARQLKSELQSPSEERERAMYELAIETLQQAGFEHYEVSNFARPNHRCRHNENYWLCGEYFGIGPGASSYVVNERRANHRSTTSYLKAILNGKSPVTECDQLDKKETAHERLVFGLRRLTGIDTEQFLDSTGYRVEDLVGENLTWLSEKGFLEMVGQNIRLTRKGLLVSDSIWPYLL